VSAVYDHDKQSALNTRGGLLRNAEPTRLGRSVVLAVVQLHSSGIELNKGESHVVRSGVGLDRLKGRDLPRTTGLGVATVESELRQLVTAGVANDVPPGQL